MTTTPFSVCVYCGSRPGTDPAYMQTAHDFGTAIAAEGWRLVFGAGDVGIMGAVAEATRRADGRTLGVIPTHLLGRETQHGPQDDRVITETMHERKKVMIMNADAVVMLPGGAGSLDEFFEALTWRQLGLHDKPIVLLDVNGYWQPLVSLINHVVDQGFAEASVASLFQIARDAAAAVDILRAARSDM